MNIPKFLNFLRESKLDAPKRSNILKEFNESLDLMIVRFLTYIMETELNYLNKSYIIKEFVECLGLTEFNRNRTIINDYSQKLSEQIFPGKKIKY